MSEPTTDWHAGADLLRQYADGRLDPIAQAAVETHVEACVDCRAVTTTLVAPVALAPVWDKVLVEVRTPEPAWPARLLRRLGLPEVDVVVLRTSGNLVVAMAVAVAGTITFALAASQLGQERQQVAWLAFAPLLPALLVAAAYDSTDPFRELAEPTPYSKLRVALLRTLAAVLLALPLVLAMALVPNIGVSVAGWLLPALAITSILLVMLTRTSALVAVGAVTAGWLVAITAMRAGDQIDAATAPVGQLLSLVVAVACSLVLVRHHGLVRTRKARP